jgi:hypothetical protein
MAFYVRPSNLLDQKLTENGDGTGNDSAVGSYTPGAPGLFYAQPPSGTYYDLFELELTFTTATGFEASQYGNGAVLTNGITITVDDDTQTIHDILNGAITTNAGWGVVLDIDTLIEPGNSSGILTGKTLFVARFGKPIRLIGSLNHRIVVSYQDDMSTRVTAQIVSVAGEFGVE